MAASGSNIQLSFIEEVTWGVTPATPQMKNIRGVTGESLGASIEQIKSAELNPQRSVSDAKPGQKKVEGDVNFELGIHGMVSMISRLFGSVSTTGTGPYIHTISVGTEPKSITMEKFFGDISRGFVLRGLKPNSGSFTANPEGAVTGSIGFLGKTFEATTAKLDLTPTELSHGMYDGIRATATIDGIAEDFQAFSLNYTNNLKDYRSVGSDLSTSITAGLFDVSGTFTIAYNNNTLINKAIAGTRLNIVITFTNSVHSIVFKIPAALLNGNVIPVAGSQEQVNLEFGFDGLIDAVPASPTLGKSIQIVVTSDEAIL